MTFEKQSRIKIVEGFEMILEGLGIDWEGDPHMAATPERAAHAWFDEICAGLTRPEPRITTFPSEDNNMVLLKDIPVMSICSHHLLPFIGTACVAYIPGRGQILGLSKLSRIVNYHARRPQVQETLTEQIATYIFDILDDKENAGVGVVIEARHMCMELRGVKHSSNMITSSLRGKFLQSAMRAEFLSLAGV